MASCSHVAWLQLAGVKDFTFVDTGRMGRLIQELTRPAEKTPMVLFFLGRKAKDAALRELFPNNNINRCRSNGLADIRTDTTTIDSQSPILFADGYPTGPVLPRHIPFHCHESKLFPVQWPFHEIQTLFDVAFAKVLLPFCSVVTIFIDDFTTIDEIRKLLVRWAALGIFENLPIQVRPRLVIVGSSTKHDIVDMENFCATIGERNADIGTLFSDVVLVILGSPDLSPLARHRQLKETVFAQMDVMKELYWRHHWTTCLAAYGQVVENEHSARYHCQLVAKYFRSRFDQIRKGCGTSAELHAAYLESSEGNFMHLRSNNTCLYCLLRNPQYVLSCHHAICDTCVKIYGKAVVGAEYEYTISACLLCRSWGSVTAQLKPPTAGVRILSIDGGGTRGVVPLEYLRLVQEDVGKTIPVQDLIDFAIGTSSGYKHVRPDRLEDEPFVWEAARATSAAPIFFRPAHIPAHGAFQDGGLKHNNPINLALTETRAIWPTSSCPDVVLSLGTGMAETQSPVAPHFRHVFNDGFIPRLYRSFMSSFDGESVWRDLQNRLDERAKRDYFRFNLEMQDTPLIDDTSRMNEFRQSVSAQPSTREHCHDVTIALLVSCFFFELETVPCFDKGVYRCEGTVRCRTASENVARVLSAQYTRIEYVTDGGVLGAFDSYHDVCWACRRYSKRLLFYVQHPSDVISLELRLGDHQRRRLSGFPQSMEWFVRQQGLDADFGAPDHGSPGTLYCRVCDPTRSLLRKRKNGSSNLAHSKKAKTADNATMKMSPSRPFERPVTIFPRYAAVSGDAKPEEDKNETLQPAKGSEKEIRKLTKPAPERKAVPRIPVFVRPSSNIFSSNPSTVRQSEHLKTTYGSPWDAYRQLLREDQAGPATFACLKNPSFAVSVVKEHRYSSTAPVLRSVSHPNIVQITEAFLQQDTVYLIYNVMTVSLREIKASPVGDLEEYELAAVCKEVNFAGYVGSTLAGLHTLLIYPA
ncbi:MAG: hypothetical protein Q9165_008510 [Trypethelium subeluteriae]